MSAALQPPDYLDELDAAADAARADREAAERIPPHDLDAEAAVLSALIVDETALAKVRGGLRPDSFYSESHRRIYEAVLSLAAEGKPCDVLTLATWLRDHKRIAQVGGIAYLTEVLNAAPAVANVVAYAQIVQSKWRARQVILRAQRIVALGYAGEDTARALAELGAIDPPGQEARDALVVPAAGEWFTTAPPARAWLLRDARANGAGVLPLGTVGQLVAEGGAGKTMALAQLAVAVATGTRWLGALDVTTPGRVLLVLGEEDADEVRRRLYRAGRVTPPHTAPPPADSIVTLPLRSVVCALLESDTNGNPSETAFGAWLRRYVEAHGPWSLVAVDPLSRFAGLDAETDNAAGTRYVQALESLAALGPAVLGSHHTHKLARGPGGKVEAHSARGSSSIVDGARWVATLARDRFDHGDADVNARLGRIVTLTPGGKSNVSREAAPIELRYDDDNGGALVPLDDADREWVRAARSGTAARSAKTSERDADRAQVRATRTARDAADREARAAEREEATRRRDADDDAAAREIRAAHPSAPVRDLVPLLRKARACGGTRAHAALVRVRVEP